MSCQTFLPFCSFMKSAGSLKWHSLTFIRPRSYPSRHATSRHTGVWLNKKGVVRQVRYVKYSISKSYGRDQSVPYPQIDNEVICRDFRHYQGSGLFTYVCHQRHGWSTEAGKGEEREGEGRNLLPVVLTHSDRHSRV